MIRQTPPLPHPTHASGDQSRTVLVALACLLSGCGTANENAKTPSSSSSAEGTSAGVGDTATESPTPHESETGDTGLDGSSESTTDGSGDSGGGDTDGSQTDGGSSTDTGDGSSTDGSSSDDPPPATVSLHGTLRGVAGDPLPGISIALCDPMGCKGGKTDDAGTYRIEQNITGWYTFDLVGEAITEGNRAFALAIIEIDADLGDRQYDLVATRYTMALPMPAQPEEVEIAPSLFITLGPDSLEKGWSTPHELDTIGGTLVPEDERLGTEGTPPIIAFWHLAPFEAEAETPLPLRIRNDFDAAPNQEYAAWQVDYTAQSWTQIATLTLVDGFLVGDSELTVLNTLVLTQAP